MSDRVRWYYYKVEATGRTPDIKHGDSKVWLARGGEGKSWRVVSRVRERSKRAAEHYFRRTHKEFRRYCRQSGISVNEMPITITRIRKGDSIV